MTDILIIPDAHAHPEYDNERFKWLGRFILESRPDMVVCLGDLGDMPSLSSYDRGTKGFEGRRYRKDCEASRSAQEAMFEPLETYNTERRGLKKAQYQPATVFLVGNHEDRIDRLANAHPELDGQVDLRKNLALDKYWSQVVEFKVPFFHAGIGFCHFFPSGVMGNAIGGKHIASSLLDKMGMSCVVGHNHLLDYSERTRADGTRMFGLSAGCFTHPDMKEGWNKNTADSWWRGVITLKGCKDGYFKSAEVTTMDKLRSLYAD